MPNLLYKQQCNPARIDFRRPHNPLHRPFDDPDYPYLLTTYRLTEHHTAGGMSRWLSWLSELQPEMFVEVSPELAAERGLENGGWCHVITARAAIEGRVLVTDRLTPLRVEGRTVHQVWLPYHWGPGGMVTGDSANDLFGISLDPNVLIQESKVGTCDVRAGRRPTGKDLLGFVAGYQHRSGVFDDHQVPIVTTGPSSTGAERGDSGDPTPEPTSDPTTEQQPDGPEDPDSNADQGSPS
jgi:formate dehydrogenase major subunit